MLSVGIWYFVGILLIFSKYYSGMNVQSQNHTELKKNGQRMDKE